MSPNTSPLGLLKEIASTLFPSRPPIKSEQGWPESKQGSSSDTYDESIERAKSVIRKYLPLFESLNSSSIDYCLVGGLAVQLRLLESGMSGTYPRMTVDADLMFPSDLTNSDFAEIFVSALSPDDGQRKEIETELFPYGINAAFENEEAQHVSCSFCAPETSEAFGMEVDVVRMLNEVSLSTVQASLVDFEGVQIKVATTAQLFEMKHKTIDLLRADALHSSRPQDFIDLGILNSILEYENEVDADSHLGSVEDLARQAIQDDRHPRNRTYDHGDR